MSTHIPWHRLAVTELDALRYRVESESHNGTYMVDVAVPQCDCSDFKCRVAPVLAGKKDPPDDPRWIAACKHVLRAKLFVADMVIKKFNEQTTK